MILIKYIYKKIVSFNSHHHNLYKFLSHLINNTVQMGSLCQRSQKGIIDYSPE